MGPLENSSEPIDLPASPGDENYSIPLFSSFPSVEFEVVLRGTSLVSTLLFCQRHARNFAKQHMNTVNQLKTVQSNTATKVGAELSRTGGLLRLAPAGCRARFSSRASASSCTPTTLYAFGLNRGGIDERWFASHHAGGQRQPHAGRRPELRASWAGSASRSQTPSPNAARRSSAKRFGSKYKKWPVYSKFFDNMGPIPHHMHQSPKQAKLVGQEGKPESYYFPPQHNNVGNNFPYTFMGLEPGTTKAQVRKCLEDWNKGDNGILDLSKAYRLKPGTGWLIDPCMLHAPGSLCTYEPQWGTDVFGMYQTLVEGREVPWALLVKDMPKSKHKDLDFIVEQLDWDKNVDPNFKDNHYLEPVPVADTRSEGYVDRWIVYGKVDGEQLFTAKELTVEPGAKCTIKDNGAYGLICVQGTGKINGQPLESARS